LAKTPKEPTQNLVFVEGLNFSGKKLKKRAGKTHRVFCFSGTKKHPAFFRMLLP